MLKNNIELFRQHASTGFFDLVLWETSVTLSRTLLAWFSMPLKLRSKFQIAHLTDRASPPIGSSSDTWRQIGKICHDGAVRV